MTEPRKRAGRPRCAALDHAILDATLRQLAEHGYTRASVDAIAAEAGTTKPAIYRRWPSKEALAIAAVAHLQAQDEPAPTGDVEADLVRLLADFRKKLLRPNGMSLIGTVLAEESHVPALMELFRRNVVQPRRRGLLAILEAARQHKQLRPDADLDAAVNLLVGSFYARYLTGEEVTPDWPERVVRTVLAGLRT
jgi:AcrR family transcriptional regulator